MARWEQVTILPPPQKIASWLRESRIAYVGAGKSQQCHKYFPPYSTFGSKRSQVRTWGRQTCFLPRTPSNLVTPLGSHQRHTFCNLANEAIPSPRGLFLPKRSSKPPQIETETLYINGVFVNFRMSSPPAEMQIPPIENFLATGSEPKACDVN